MEFSIKIKGLDKLNRAFKESPKMIVRELKQAIKTSVFLIRPMMVRNAPVDTSKLRQNISAKASGLEGVIGPNMRVTPYAWFVHEGTRPHIIRVKKAKVLADVKRGLIFGPVVHHPGTRANPFVERTADEAKEPVNKIFQKAANDITVKLTR